MYDDKLINILSSIQGAKELSHLMDFYEQILNAMDYLSNFQLEKVQAYINEIYTPIKSIDNEKLQEIFNKNHYFVSLFRKLLLNLYVCSKSKSYKFNSWNIDVNGRGNESLRGSRRGTKPL
jgi:hypothetical protein